VEAIMTQPLVSIVISSYNHKTYVEDAIQSALNQTYPNFEVIVTDDGSTDGSADLIEKLHQTHGFTYIRQENHGLCWSMNNMIGKVAKGKYIAPLGSDDLMTPDRLSIQVAFMETHPEYAATGGNMLAIDPDGQPLERQRHLAARTFDFDDIFWRRVGGIPAPTAMFLKSVFDELGGYNEDLRLEDLDFWLRMTYAGHKLFLLPDVLCKYRTHPTNVHHNLRLMVDNILATYAPYKKHEKYDMVIQDLYLSTLLKASISDKGYARELLRRTRFFYKPGKYLKALLRYFFQ
jgi:alpha-1,3-rhamnosyltransferase